MKPQQNSGATEGCAPPSCSRLPDDEKTSDIICDTKLAMLDMMEDLAAVVCHLREAYGSCENGNIRGAEMDAESAVETLNAIEVQASRLAADLAKWIEW